MALHERFDSGGRRILLTDKELHQYEFPGSVVLVGLATALITPGLLAERYVCPLLGGCAWLLVGVLISGALAYGLCLKLGVKGGLAAYVLVSIGSTYVLFSTEPTTYRRYEAEQRGLSDAEKGEECRFQRDGRPEYQDVYGEAYKRGVLARPDRRVKANDFASGKVVDRTGEVVDFSFTKRPYRDQTTYQEKLAYVGEYTVKTPEGEVFRTFSVEFIAKTH